MLLLRGPRGGVALATIPLLDKRLGRPNVELSTCRIGVPGGSYVLYEYLDEGDPDRLPAIQNIGNINN